MQRNEKEDPIWFYALIGILTSMAINTLWPQGPQRPDTGYAAARAIIDRAHSAAGLVGGRSRMRYIHTIAQTELPAIKTVTETWFIAPNRVLTRTTMEGSGTVEMGYNGEVGWTTSPLTGPVLIEGEQLKTLAKMADGNAWLNETFKTLSVGPRSMVEGRDVVSVAFKNTEGLGGILYFDVKSGLLHATSTRIPEIGGDSLMWAVLTDYTRFDGELLPLTTTMKGQGNVVVTRTTHVDHKPIDSTFFTPPAAVRALLKRP